MKEKIRLLWALFLADFKTGNNYINYLCGLFVPQFVCGILSLMKWLPADLITWGWFTFLAGIASWGASFCVNVPQIMAGEDDTNKKGFKETIRTGFGGFLGGKKG